MTCQQGKPSSGQSGKQFAQKLVNQEPVYDRKLKVHRPRKKKGDAKWL